MRAWVGGGCRQRSRLRSYHDMMNDLWRKRLQKKPPSRRSYHQSPLFCNVFLHKSFLISNQIKALSIVMSIIIAMHCFQPFKNMCVWRNLWIKICLQSRISGRLKDFQPIWSVVQPLLLFPGLLQQQQDQSGSSPDQRGRSGSDQHLDDWDQVILGKTSKRKKNFSNRALKTLAKWFGMVNGSYLVIINKPLLRH